MCNGVVCVDCNDDADCEAENPGDVCQSAQCITPCTSGDPTCPSGEICDELRERCVAQCLTTANCAVGETCDAGACICTIPEIDDAFVSGGGQWPIILSVSISPVGSTSNLQYRATFKAAAGWEVGSPFQSSAPITLQLPPNCDGPNEFWGCVNSCGINHSASGVVEVQLKNGCGAVSEILTIPTSGECDLCSGQVCQ